MGRTSGSRVRGLLPQESGDPLKRLDPFPRLARELARADVRYVMIGVAGVNHYAQSAGALFATQDRDLFLPPDPANELRALKACRRAGLELWCGDAPLGRPLDAVLAAQIVARRALVRAEGRIVRVDLTLVMAGFAFEPVWGRRRRFRVQGVEIPVARLTDIVRSKAAAGRPKDDLFLATHREELRRLLLRQRARRAGE